MENLKIGLSQMYISCLPGTHSGMHRQDAAFRDRLWEVNASNGVKSAGSAAELRVVRYSDSQTPLSADTALSSERLSLEERSEWCHVEYDLSFPFK
nr:hypothetical protein CFP56_58099 [Quercus suber]